jgi:hypothetical protein
MESSSRGQAPHGGGRYTLATMLRATVVACALAVVATTAHADEAAARKLGAAYAAYDAGDLAGATAALDGVTAAQLANPDYLLWLRGQLGLLDGRPADAARRLHRAGGDVRLAVRAHRAVAPGRRPVGAGPARRRRRSLPALRAAADADDARRSRRRRVPHRAGRRRRRPDARPGRAARASCATTRRTRSPPTPIARSPPPAPRRPRTPTTIASPARSG